MKKHWKTLKRTITAHWQIRLLVVAAVAGITFLLTYSLSTLLGGMSASEYGLQQRLVTNEIQLETLAQSPIFLPYTALLYLMQYTPFSGQAAIRIVGVFFGLLSVAGMYYIFSKWYTSRIALLGIALYATTSWFLHTSRYADPAASYLLSPLLIGAMIALQAKARSRLAMGSAIVFGISAIYIPGFVWFILPALFIKRRVILAALSIQPLWFKISSGILGSLMMMPLLVMVIKPLPGVSALDNVLSILGFPVTDFPSPLTMLSTVKDSFADIFAYGTAGPIYIPGHMPWLDICTVLLVVLGAIQFLKYRSLDRSKLIAIVGGMSIVLIGLNGLVSSVILLPFVFLFAVEGLKWLLERWMQIFPKNPFARSFALTLVTVLVISIGAYQTNKYFLAWARSPETRAEFRQLPQ